MEAEMAAKKLRILPSEIHGHGIFADKDIQKHDVIGLTHYYFEKAWYQTFPYGLYNHTADDPNCRPYMLEEGPEELKHILIVANRDISEGEEILCDYCEIPFLEQPEEDWK